MLFKKFRHARIKTAVAFSSKNCAAMLKSAALSRLIDARTDEFDAERLPGKPDPVLFLKPSVAWGQAFAYYCVLGCVDWRAGVDFAA